MITLLAFSSRKNSYVKAFVEFGNQLLKEGIEIRVYGPKGFVENYKNVCSEVYEYDFENPDWLRTKNYSPIVSAFFDKLKEDGVKTDEVIVQHHLTASSVLEKFKNVKVSLYSDANWNHEIMFEVGKEIDKELDLGLTMMDYMNFVICENLFFNSEYVFENAISKFKIHPKILLSKQQEELMRQKLKVIKIGSNFADKIKGLSLSSTEIKEKFGIKEGQIVFYIADRYEDMKKTNMAIEKFKLFLEKNKKYQEKVVLFLNPIRYKNSNCYENYSYSLEQYIEQNKKVIEDIENMKCKVIIKGGYSIKDLLHEIDKNDKENQFVEYAEIMSITDIRISHSYKDTLSLLLFESLYSGSVQFIYGSNGMKSVIKSAGFDYNKFTFSDFTTFYERLEYILNNLEEIKKEIQNRKKDFEFYLDWGVGAKNAVNSYLKK